ncbi:MAG: RNA repair domain-containing protein [Steroidobacter sp.]
MSLRDLRFDPESSFSFQLFDPEGRLLSIPLHRIRKVYRDGELIWSRPEGE